MAGHADKVIILAYDGLEATLVEEWGLRNILQEYHGTHSTVISPVTKEPLTPVIWTSFITGLPPEKHGVKLWWRYEGFVERIRWLPPIRWIPGKRKLIEKLRKLGIPVPVKKRLVRREDIEDVRRRYGTLFDEYPSTVIVWPIWNEPEKIRYEYHDAVKTGVDEFLQTAWKWHRWRRDRLFSTLPEWIKSDKRILAVWFDLSDLVGHMCIAKCPERLMEAYYELDSIARRVRRLVRQSGERIAVLIVSDHGMKPVGDMGDHTDYGFWSLNIEPPFRPKSILDFRRLIEEILG